MRGYKTVREETGEICCRAYEESYRDPLPLIPAPLSKHVSSIVMKAFRLGDGRIKKDPMWKWRKCLVLRL